MTSEYEQLGLFKRKEKQKIKGLIALNESKIDNLRQQYEQGKKAVIENRKSVFAEGEELRKQIEELEIEKETLLKELADFMNPDTLAGLREKQKYLSETRPEPEIILKVLKRLGKTTISRMMEEQELRMATGQYISVQIRKLTKQGLVNKEMEKGRFYFTAR